VSAMTFEPTDQEIAKRRRRRLVPRRGWENGLPSDRNPLHRRMMVPSPSPTLCPTRSGEGRRFGDEAEAGGLERPAHTEGA